MAKIAEDERERVAGILAGWGKSPDEVSAALAADYEGRPRPAELMDGGYVKNPATGGEAFQCNAATGTAYAPAFVRYRRWDVALDGGMYTKFWRSEGV